MPTNEYNLALFLVLIFGAIAELAKRALRSPVAAGAERRKVKEIRTLASAGRRRLIPQERELYGLEPQATSRR